MVGNYCPVRRILRCNYRGNNRNVFLHNRRLFFHVVEVVVVVEVVAVAVVVVVAGAVVEGMGRLDVALAVLVVEAEVDNPDLDYKRDNLFRKNLF